MKRLIVAGAMLGIVALVGSAQADGVAVAAKVGTMGPGVDVTLPLVPENLNLRLTGSYVTFGVTVKTDDVDYDSDLTLTGYGALLDWHPFQNNFRVSGGALYNGSEVDLDGTGNSADATIKIGDHEYATDAVGILHGTGDYNAFAPYLGIGFGNAVQKDRAWGFVFDLGVVFTGSATVHLSATGPAAALPEFQQDLAQNESDVQDKLDKVPVYPVLAFGVSYQF